MSDSEGTLYKFSEDAECIGAECPHCGRVLKVYRRDLRSAECGYATLRPILCKCGRTYGRIALSRQSRKTPSGLSRSASSTAARPVTESSSADRKGYSHAEEYSFVTDKVTGDRAKQLAVMAIDEFKRRFPERLTTSEPPCVRLHPDGIIISIVYGVRYGETRGAIGMEFGRICKGLGM